MVEILFFSLVNGIIYGFFLFLLASGLTVTFSMMGVLNFAHGSFYMLGAYIAYSISKWFRVNQIELFGIPISGYWVGLIVAPVIVGIIGALIQRYALNYVRKHGPIPELIFTFSLAFLMLYVVVFIWGGGGKPFLVYVPDSLKANAFTFLNTPFPNYRVFALAVSVAIFAGLLLFLKNSRTGLIVQASITHPNVVGMLGHNVSLVFMYVFGIGSMLAGVAGVIAGPVLFLSPAMGLQLGNIVFVVVVFGGLGSLTGAFIASMIMGIVQTLAASVDGSLADVAAFAGQEITADNPFYDVLSITLPQISALIPYLLMVMILIFRPYGLMGNRE